MGGGHHAGVAPACGSVLSTARAEAERYPLTRERMVHKLFCWFLFFSTSLWRLPRRSLSVIYASSG